MGERKNAILGGGRIGEALLSGLLSSGWRDPSEIVITSRREERLAELRERYGAKATADNVAAVTGAGLVVVAVKPQDIDELLTQVGQHLTMEQTVVSIAAAIPTAHIQDRIAAGVPIVRAMPNAPATVHEGMAGILLGLSREVSTTLVVQTMFGTAKQLRDQGMHPVELRESVTSPGGTTIAAIRELEQAGVRAAFLNAIQAAMDRARELADGG